MMKKWFTFFAMATFVLALGALNACKSSKGKKSKKTSVTKSEVRTPAPKNIDTSVPGDPKAGAKVFKEKCQACHGADGRGNGGVTAADFIKDKSRLQKDNKVLIASITNGVKNKGRIMPAHKGTLTPKQIRDALSFIRVKFGKQKK